MDNKRQHAGKVILQLLHQEGSKAAQDAIDYFVTPPKGIGCDEGELGLWFYEIIALATRDAHSRRSGKGNGKQSLIQAFKNLGLSASEARTAADIKPFSQPSPAKLRQMAGELRRVAGRFNQVIENMSLVNRHWLYTDPDVGSVLINHAKTLEVLATRNSSAKRVGRPRKNDFAPLTVSVCALTTYITEKVGRKKPPFNKIVELLRAAYRNPHLGGGDARFPALFQGDTLRKIYRRKHPRSM